MKLVEGTGGDVAERWGRLKVKRHGPRRGVYRLKGTVVIWPRTGTLEAYKV